MAIRQQIVEAVSDGLKAPDTFLRAVALYRGEDRTAEYIVLPKSLVEPIEEPSDAVLSTWFEENKATYAAPEYRKIAYVSSSRKTSPTKRRSPTSRSRKTTRRTWRTSRRPRRARSSSSCSSRQEAAQAALDSIKAGATFDIIVTAEGKTAADTLLGTFAKDKVPDPAVAEAAFALQANEVSPIVEGAFGPVLLRVTEIKPEVVRSLAEVTPEIRKDLALAEANRILLDVHDSYEDSRAAGELLREAAAKLDLKVVTVDAIDRAAQRPDGSVVNDLPQSKELLDAAFEAETGIENPAVNIGGNGFVFYEVEGITPARDRTLDEVKAKAVADWKAAETEKRLGAKAAELEKRLKDGDAARHAGRRTEAREADQARTEARSRRRRFRQAPAWRRSLALPKAAPALVPAPTGDAQILFKVTEVFEPAGADANSVPEDAQKSFAVGPGRRPARSARRPAAERVRACASTAPRSTRRWRFRADHERR